MPRLYLLLYRGGYFGVVYLIENCINGKKYVGQTNNLSKRIRYHRSFYKTKNTKLYKAMRKYGIENFKFRVLVETDDLNVLEDYELYYIWKFRTLFNGYNQRLVFVCHNREFRHTNETKQKIRESKLGKLNPMYKKSLSKETKEKIRQGVLNSALCKRIVMIQYSTMSVLATFNNRTEAEQFTGIKKGTIWARLKKKLVVDDIIWAYEEDFITGKVRCNDYRKPKR